MNRVLACLLGLLCASSAQAAYVPPAGVPAPSFGIDQANPAPNCWVNAATGSDANTCLVEASPRATIPRSLGPGAIVKVSGTQTFDYEGSSGRLHLAGTIGSPIFILSDSANPMVFTNLVETDGTYFIWDGGSGKGIIVEDGILGADTNHAAVRNTTQTGPSYIFAGFGGTVNDVVFYNNVMHDTGNMFAGEAGGDQHCTKVNNAHMIWVLASILYHCNGDGVQVGDVAHGLEATTYFVYLAGNICVANRQTCTWAKRSSGVVMTGNIAAYMRSIPEPPPPSGVYLNPAACYGAQYYALYLTIMQNICAASDAGIRIAGYDSRGTTISIIGNTIYYLHSSIGPGAGGIDYGGALGHAIALTGDGGDILVAHNTIYDVDAGIGSTPGIKSLTYFNNLLAVSGHHDVAWNTTAPTLTYNGYDNTPILHPATSNFNTVVGDPLFIGATSGEFCLQAASPDFGTGFAWDVNLTYTALHGVSTGLDYSTTPSIGACQTDPTTPTSHPVVRLRVNR
jgi:hypothetical protein